MSRLTPTEKYDGPSKLSLDIGDPLRFGLEAYTEGNEAPFLELDIPMDNPHLPLDDIFVIFSSEVQPTLVTELTVSDTFMEDVTAAKWLNILPLFKNLKYLNFTFCPPSTVVSVLPHVENQSLEIIMLLSVPRSGKHSEDDSKVTLSTFEEFLRNRKASGLPLPKILIKRCKITRPEVDSLRRYVSVDWDGVEDDEEGS
ncbi:hypothetical protein ONZ45_g18563 [Pleurotus djamor]|nr:hypothetical protein ONZ45_g18563 [Pleurotus djamor]